MNPDLIKLGSAAQALGGALGVGLLVGLERGWRDRDLPEGGRVAGLRTFALIGLLGGLLALLSSTPGLLLAAGLIGIVLLFVTLHLARGIGHLHGQFAKHLLVKTSQYD